MKNIFKTSILFLTFLTFSSGAFALKVVVFDHQQAILQTNADKQVIAQVDNTPQFKQLLQEAEAKDAEFKALGKTFETESMTWSDEMKAENQAKAQMIRADLEKTMGQNQSLRNQAIQQIGPVLQEVMTKAVEVYQAKENIDIILPKGNAYFVKEELDITPFIIKEMDLAIENAQKSAVPEGPVSGN